MLLILGSGSDSSALWLARGLSARGMDVEWVDDTALGTAYDWHCEITSEATHIAFTLRTGRRIDSRRVRGVVNRLSFVPSAAAVRVEDRDYIVSESLAFYLGWLNCFDVPVLNRATPQGLPGSFRTRSEWLSLACGAGLEVAHQREQTHRGSAILSDRTPHSTALGVPLLVVGDRVVTVDGRSAVPGSVVAGSVRLARTSQAEIMGLGFEVDAQRRWCFREATPCPDLRPFGDAALRAVERTLQLSRGEGRAA